ncbi:MAG: outer membrane beta-barrel protein [Bacteroidota bacterium]
MIKAKVHKAVVLSCLIVLFASSIGFAQKGVQVGVRFIPQSTSFIFNTGFPLVDMLKLAPYYARFRTAQGIGVLYNPHEHWSIGADVLYSLHGGGYETRTTNVNYLKVPVWLGYNANSRHKLMFNMQIGLDFAYVMNANMTYKDGDPVNIIHAVNRTNWGMPFAMGFKFKFLKSYYLNTQIYIYADVKTLSKTNPGFEVKDYILPGFRFSIDRRLGK